MQDPIKIFDQWYKEAQESEDLADAMCLSTVSAEGRPSSRMVLLKDYGHDGFVFYTNLGSRKAQEISENSYVALCFHWKSLLKQVRIEGKVEAVSAEEADRYFATRARDSQIGAWASKQSQEMGGRFEFEKRIAKYTAKFGVGAVDRPEFWSGFRVKVDRIELWQDRKFRLHMRDYYEYVEGQWQLKTLYP